MSSKKITTYNGKNIDVHWDERLCIHVAECGKAEGELFVGGRDPWCQPDLVDEEHVKDVVTRCPSGALSYTDKAGGNAEKPAKINAIQVAYNGPLFVAGDLDIEGAPEDMPGVRCRAALCRCGRSKNKPFCDNSHVEAGFQDFGAVGEKGEGMETTGGALHIRGVPNGPLLVSGNFAIVASSGRIAWHGTRAALCRCGLSKNKPFCDGSHNEAGFAAE